MEFIANHTGSAWLIFGIILLLLEVFAFGFIGLLFASLAAMTLGSLVSFNIIDADINLVQQLTYFFAFTFAWAIILWKPLKKLRAKKSGHDDYAGTFAIIVEEDIKRGSYGYAKWSGVKMRVKLSEESEKEVVKIDEEVKVEKNEKGVLILC